MRSDLPKVLHPVAGLPMIRHVLTAVGALDPDHVVVVLAPGMDAVANAVAPFPVAIQPQPLGTADAVRAAGNTLRTFEGDVLVLYGDTPLITTETLKAMVAARNHPSDPAVVVMGIRLAEPGGYGRLVLNARGELERIVEALDASQEERAITLCNGGLMAFDGARLFTLLDQIRNDNAKGEYYLTDMVGLARAAGHGCRVVEGAPTEALGVNSRAELAEIEHMCQQRLRRAAMDGGATLTDPQTVYLSFDTKLGRDVTVGQNVVFGQGVTIEDRVDIRPFCHLEQVHVESGALIGPFARLRPGTHIAEGVHIGNFVEIKNAQVQSGAKINHLTYIGDADIGARANIGAGTITCNYDGVAKHRTEIGEGAFIGSNTALVAPVTIGDGAMVGAGSVITEPVAADALAVARGKQRSIPGWASRFRSARRKEDAKT